MASRRPTRRAAAPKSFPQTPEELLFRILIHTKKLADDHRNDLTIESTHQLMAQRHEYLLLNTGPEEERKEGDYKFWDDAALKLFMERDGNPTAGRALRLAMAFRSIEMGDVKNVSSYLPMYKGAYTHVASKDIFMRFKGTIDQKAANSKGTQKIALQNILEPMKFLDEFEITCLDRIDYSYCIPFWEFAVNVINNAPHMLKEGYPLSNNANPDSPKHWRRSWARILVMLFLPKSEVFEMMADAGLLFGQDYFDEAREWMGDVLYTAVPCADKKSLHKLFLQLWGQISELRRNYWRDTSSML